MILANLNKANQAKTLNLSNSDRDSQSINDTKKGMDTLRTKRKNVILDSNVLKQLDKNSISASCYESNSDISTVSSEFNYLNFKDAFNQGYVAGRLNNRPIWKRIVLNQKTKETKEDLFDPNTFFLQNTIVNESENIEKNNNEEEENNNEEKNINTKDEYEDLSIYEENDRVKIIKLRERRKVINQYYLNLNNLDEVIPK